LTGLLRIVLTNTANKLANIKYYKNYRSSSGKYWAVDVFEKLLVGLGYSMQAACILQMVKNPYYRKKSVRVATLAVKFDS